MAAKASVLIVARHAGRRTTNGTKSSVLVAAALAPPVSISSAIDACGARVSRASTCGSLDAESHSDTTHHRRNRDFTATSELQPQAPVSDVRTASPLDATAQTQRRRGRLPSHTEHWPKVTVTVVLFDRQVVFLDRLVADIRASSGAAVRRAHVIRALVDALAESDLDLTSTRSEADLRRLLANRLRPGVTVA